MIRKTLAVLGFVLALPVGLGADCLSSGIDVWHTNSGTHANIPAGFFCRASPAVQVSLTGGTLVSDPSLDGADTVIHRLDEICFDGSGKASGIEIRLAALSLQGSVSACGVTWTAKAHRRPPAAGEDDVTEITVTEDGDHGGTFTGSLNVPARIVFTSSNGELTQDAFIEFSSMGGAWATEQGEGGHIVEGPVTVDTDGDGDLTDETQTFPGNDTGFHPGWDGSITDPPVPVEVEHEGADEDHLTDPVPPPPTCHPDVIAHLTEAEPNTFPTTQAGSSTVVGVDSTTVLNGRSIKILTPCRFVDSAVLYVVGISR